MGKKEKTDIVLIDFITSLESKRTNLSSLGLASIKAVLDEAGIRSEIVVADYGSLAQKDIIKSLERKITKSKPKFVGISVLSHTYHLVKRLVKAIRNEDHLILVGGHLPTTFAEGVLNDLPYVDYAFIGEGEISLLKFLKTNEKERTKVQGIAYKYNNSIRIVKQKEPCDLNKLPQPFPDHLLRGAMKCGKSAIPIEIQRGCNYAKCVFCDISAFYKRGYEKTILSRYKNISRVMDEIFYWNNRGINAFALRGDNLLENGSYITNLTKEIENSGQKIVIGLTTRTDEILKKRDIVERLYASRFMHLGGISIGFESNTQNALNLLNKGTSPEINEKVIKLINYLNKKYNKSTEIFYNFILFPHFKMNFEDLTENIKFVGEYIPFSQMALHPSLKTIAYPGTNIWLELKRKGYKESPVTGFIINYNFDDERIERLFQYFVKLSKKERASVIKEIYHSANIKSVLENLLVKHEKDKVYASTSKEGHCPTKVFFK